MKQQKKAVDSEPDVFVYIIGSNMLQNELLLSFLDDKIGLKGDCLSKLELVSLFNKSKSVSSIFFLIDCKSCNVKALWQEISSLKESNHSQCFVALYNADPKSEIEKMAMSYSVDGIFLDTDSYNSIPKGIAAILKGDLWYSRKSMTKFLLESKNFANSSENAYAKDLLTSREREVLALIALGQNSREVSEKLFISSHTVKTHIYHIYSKINVTNRLQATLWAAKNL